MNRSRSVVLLGMPAAGKSCVGAHLASILRCRFIDTDVEIERTAGCNTETVVARGGWPLFRRMERRVIRRVAGQTGVIALGGGAWLDANSRDLLARTGITFWLAPPIEVLAKRIEATPRLMFSGDDVLAQVADLARHRAPIYRLAHHRINCGNAAPVAVARSVCRILERDAVCQSSHKGKKGLLDHAFR